ncbi:MAG: flagellar assembly peptidoglycan hydrolase FlgJ [Ideonella sp. MAG2]|nr:MAG: flagellar assembly peptidoglycan hydrolase FlgJ [Ideonella sp. MAG2]
MQGAGFGDVRGLALLKQRAAQDPKAVTREAAKQFEAIFMQELLKNMRKATLAEDPLSNEGSKLGYEMLDTQLATKLSGAPGSLSDVIAKQLDRQMGLNPGPIPKVDKQALAKPVELNRPEGKVGPPQKAAANFVLQHTKTAEAVEQSSGIPAEFMIAQAAHESGWGRKEIKRPDGSSAHNLFGIKATGNWKGDTVDVTTTEYINGVARKVVQKFRAYDNYADSFKDYAQLIKNSPRYANVVAAGADAKGFAVGLQKAGYATDPAYAEKLGRVINTTLRLQRTLNV